MFNRLRERASSVYHGGDVTLPTPDPDPDSDSARASHSASKEAPNDEPHEPDQQHQGADTNNGTDTEKGTGADTGAVNNSSPETVQGDHPPSTINQSDDDDDDDAHAVNNESDSNSQTYFSFFRLAQSASKWTVTDATQAEFTGQHDPTEQDAQSTLPPVVEETSMEKTSNHSDLGFDDAHTHTQEKPSLLSRMRFTATKAFFETSATSLTGSIHSLSASRHATITTDDATNSNCKPTPSNDPHHINSDNMDTSNHSTWDFSKEIAQDPEICRLTEQIHILKTEYNSIKESGKRAQRRRQDEYSKLKQYFNGKSRELWFESQKMRRFHGIGEYKTELKRCSLPAHDTSTPTLTMEAKLLRAQHQGAILEHQLAIVHDFQQSMIDFLYTKALPDVKAEQELATIVGKSQLEKMIKARDTMVELFEDCLGLQRKIIAKYRLREIEHSRGADGERLKQEVEHLKVITGEIPAMERNPELRDSAKRRLEQRFQVKERQLERRKSREEDLIKVTQKLIDDDQALVGKANEQLASISSHSIDLLLDVTGNDDSDSDSVTDHRKAPTSGNHEMENDSGDDASECSLNDTENAEGSDDLVKTKVSNDDSAKVHPTEPSDHSATKEPHDETASESGLDISQNSLNGTGNGEGSHDLDSSSVRNDKKAKNQSTEASDQCATEESHDEMENDSGPDRSESSLNDTGNGEGSNHLVSKSVNNVDNVQDQITEPTEERVTKDLHGDTKSYSDVGINQSNDSGDEGPNDLVLTSATQDNSSEDVHSQAGPSKADLKEGTDVNTTNEVPSGGKHEPKESNDDASESQGSSRSAANRSSVTAGRNPPPGIARMRALRAARDMEASDRSLDSTSNYADGDQGASEHSNSESGEDHLEPISPRSTTRKSQLGLSANQRYAARVSTTGIRSRNELLERARLARLSNQGGTTGPTQGVSLENAASTGTGIVRPALGSKAMSSRDFASRRSIAITNPSSRSGLGLGGSEHRSPTIVSSSLSSSERSERPRTSISIAAERQARMERIASRRQSSIEVSAIHQARTDEKPAISAERRAQIRAGLASRGVGTKVDQSGDGRKE